METEIIEALREQNEEYSKYITAEEGLKRKGIQKQKLQKKDRMAEIVREYKKSRKS
jgi:uncharacterized protein YdcH (DUF465 family)